MLLILIIMTYKEMPHKPDSCRLLLCYGNQTGELTPLVCAAKGGSEIYAMDSNGNNQIRLTHDSEEKENPSWSPDGQWIAFDSYRNKVYHIYVVKTDGSGRTSRLTRRRQDHSHPAWSPDGDTIAYTIREPGGFRTINLMARNGRHLKQLSKADFYSADPDWFDPTAWSVSPVASFVTIWGEIKAPPAGRR